MSKINFFGLKKIYAFGAFSLLMAICASTAFAKTAKKMPDWVTGPSSAYAKADYLSAVGSAADKKAAEIDAINELASIFGQKISSAATSSRRMENAQKAGAVAYSDEAKLEKDILREVNQDDVIGVEIPEFFESKSEGKWYALAVINREKGSKIYSFMIEKNQKEINSILSQVKASKDPNTMLNFSRLDFAEEVSKANEGYLKRLTILNPSAAQNFESISTPAQIHKAKSEMAAKIPVCVMVDDDSDGRIAKAFQEVMASFGFNTTLGSNERYVISCKNHFAESASSNSKTKFCEYVAECALNDTSLGETLVPLSITGREGSPSYQNAEVRAKQKITGKIKGEFAASFQKYLGEFSAF